MSKFTYLTLGLFLCLFVKPIALSAQEGDFLLTHHTLDVEGLDNINFEMVSNANGQLVMANRSGVLLYDGAKFDYISTPSAVLSVALDTADNIYVGCVGDFGKVDFLDNTYQYISLNPNPNDHGIYFETLALDSDIFFISEDNLIRYDISHQKSHITFPIYEDEFFTNLLNVSDTVLVQTNLDMYQYEEDSLSQATWMMNADFLFFEKHPGLNKYLVATTANQIFIFENGTFRESKITQLLNEKQSYVNYGTWINEDYFALSTLEDGCIIYDDEQNRVVDIINQNNGLPDNEINAIVADQEEGLWISHGFGLTRLEINLPFRSFSNFRGLDGNLTQIFFTDTTRYVSTSKGVYYLERQHLYKNTVYYTIKPTKNSRPASTKKAPVAQPTKSNKKKKGLFAGKNKKKANGKKQSAKKSRKRTQEPSKGNNQKKGVFSRIGLKLSSLTQKPNGQIKKIDKKSRGKVSYVRHVKKEIVSTKYKFTKIEGLNSKIEKFITYKGKILAAGIHGVYELSGSDAELVIHEPIRFIVKEKNGDRLILSTHQNEVVLYELDGDIWVASGKIDLHGEMVLSILSEPSGKTWFATPGDIYVLDSLYSDFTDFKIYEFNNQYLDEVRMTYLDTTLYLITSQGYFYFDASKGVVKKDASLQERLGTPVRHLQQSDGIVWVYNGQKWMRINADKSVTEFEIFGLFPEMTFIDEYKSDLWLIDNSKELLKFDPQRSDSLISKNKMFFRKVENNKGDVDIVGRMNFDHDENSILFELSRPDYLGLLKVEYQHRLKGLSDEWTGWSTNNKIDFNFLPPDRYELTVRSRDSFGNIQESQTVDFIIHPPYWQTLWFYALQIALMAALVFGSMRMNRAAEKKYVLVTEGLTILTIVMVIEFLQTIAGEYFGIQSTPVVDFGIDVGIALFVFPLEQFLKKYMRADKQGPGLQGKGLLDLVRPSKS